MHELHVFKGDNGPNNTHWIQPPWKSNVRIDIDVGFGQNILGYSMIYSSITNKEEWPEVVANRYFNLFNSQLCSWLLIAHYTKVTG